MLSKIKEGLLMALCAGCVIAMLLTQVYMLEYYANKPNQKIISEHVTYIGK